MNYLFLDSSNYFLSIGLKTNTKFDKFSCLCFEKSFCMIFKINKILLRNKLTMKDINAIIVANGPGSYTGIRTTLTFAKIASFVLKIPVYILSSLAIKQKINFDSIVLINARCNRSYIAIFHKNKYLLKDQIMNNEKIKKYIKKYKKYYLIGDIDFLNLKIKNKKIDILNNMYYLFKKKKPIYDVNLIKPVYLKKYLESDK